MQAATLAEEVMALKEQVQTAHMDRDRAVEVEQLKVQVQLGLAERERAELQQQHQALIDRQMAQEELQARPVCLKRKLWCFCNAD